MAETTDNPKGGDDTSTKDAEGASEEGNEKSKEDNIKDTKEETADKVEESKDKLTPLVNGKPFLFVDESVKSESSTNEEEEEEEKKEEEKEEDEGEEENKKSSSPKVTFDVEDDEKEGDEKKEASSDGDAKEGDVVTLDDDAGDETIPIVTVSDVDFFNQVCEEEKQYYEENLIINEHVEQMKIQCTACWKQVNHLVANNIQRHPHLGVPICRNCKHFYEDGDWEKDEEGSDMFCRWCGNGGEVVGCDSCKVHVFCKRCITRNCGRSKYAEINEADEWACFTCEPSQIYKERNIMKNIARWASERRKLKKTSKKDTPKKETPKKKELTEEEKQVKLEERKRKREELNKKKEEEAIGKIENFIDENIHEAFDTLAIYQKCLEDERRKWIRARKSMNCNNAATAAKSLRRIYEITKQNMELLDHSLVEGYKSVFPEEEDRKLNFSVEPKSGGRGRKPKEAKVVAESGDDDIAVEGIVLNGEAVYANGEEGGLGDFDPSMLCSVEITPGSDQRDSSSSPTPLTPRSPPKKKRKLEKSPVRARPVVGPASVRGQMKISNKFLKKKSPKKQSPMKKKPLKRKHSQDEIEEITLDDDEDSVGYISQTQFNAVKEKKKTAKNSADDDDFDSDVSLE